MNNTSNLKLNDKAWARWSALLIIAFTMMAAYYVNDIMAPLKSMLESDLNWTSGEFGFFTGAYSFLMRSKDFDSGFENAVKQTKIFKYLGYVKDIYQDILNRSPYDDEVVFALNEHHLSREQFLVIARRTIKSLTWYMGRAVAKALKDYKDKNIAYFHETIPINPPAAIDNTISESIRRHRKEIIKRRYIFSNTKQN